MDELTFLLILAGIGVILLVSMFTYYKHHKKINDEINDFNHHTNDIDDVLLQEHSENQGQTDSFVQDLPDSFSASRQDSFDIDEVFLKHDDFEKTSKTDKSDSNDQKSNGNDQTVVLGASEERNKENTKNDSRKLVDGVYINSVRVINRSDSKPVDTVKSSSQPLDPFAPLKPTHDTTAVTEKKKQTSVIKAAEIAKQNQSLNSDEIPGHTDAGTSQVQIPITPVQKEGASAVTQKIRIIYDPLPDGVKELIISHTILARGRHFSGSKLFQALETAGLSYGEMDIYHYPGSEKNDTFALFSIANVVEPGTFNPADPESLKTPGISMFMRLPTRMGSYEAYEKFIHVAQMIAVELDGELCDETRSQLTQQAISYKKEQIRKLNFNMAKAEKLADSNH